MDELSEPLDSIEPAGDPVHLKTTAKLFNASIVIIVSIIVLSVVVKMYVVNHFPEITGVLFMIIGFAAMFLCVIPWFGLFYSWKSYRKKEHGADERRRYTIGHLAVIALTVFVFFFIG